MFAEVVITCPSDITRVVDGVVGKTSVSWSVPDSADQTKVKVESSHSPGDQFNIGDTRVTYWFYQYDNGRFIARCSFNVKIIGKFIKLMY